VNVVAIKEHLQNNVEDITKLLELSNFHHITYNSNRHEVRCAKSYDSNKTSVQVDCETLYAICYSTGVHGDIITLIQEHNELSFVDTLRHIQICLDIDFSQIKQKPNHIFGGYYRKVSNPTFDTDSNTVYTDAILNDFSNYPNLRFLRDNISIPTQIKYKIGYDPCTGRITVPWRNMNGELVGIMGRFNADVDENKWLPIIPFHKSQVLFGYAENYLSFSRNDVAYIFESEKSVMQLDTYGLRCGLATGGSYISDIQAMYIKALPVSKIVLCYDEGLSENHIQIQSNKLLNTAFFKKSISYIFDRDNEFLPKGSKCSPSDLGIQTFKQLINKCEVSVFDNSGTSEEDRRAN
jgi:hypothetical protein